MTRRSTRTVTVLFILSLVTRPVSTRLGIAAAPSGLGHGASLLRENGFHPRDIAAHLLDPADAFVLAGGALEAQVELFLAQVEQHGAKLVLGLQPHVAGLGCLRHLRRLPCGRRS